MRLDRYLSNASDFSRSQVKKLIKQGRVLVNQQVANNASQPILSLDQVKLDNAVVSPPGHRYFMLYKPQGVVSATKDSEHLTAIDCLDEPRSQQLQIAGRLDIDATGLLLITDDGPWNHQVTAPPARGAKGCLKTYQVTLVEPLKSELIEKFATGIWLDGEKRRTLPAQLEIMSEHNANLSISEGKYHQVKRMFAAMGNHVIELHRERIGEIQLDPALSAGEYRALTQAEIESI